MRSDGNSWDLPPGPVRRGLKAAVGDEITPDDYTDAERAVGFHRIPRQRAAGETGKHREPPRRRRHSYFAWNR